MRKFFIVFILFAHYTIHSQTYSTGTITITFNDPARTGGFGNGGDPGRQIQTEIYYPALTSGSNVAVANGQFPVVVIGHGFVMDWSSYDNIYSMLTKRGYIVALPRTEGGFSPNHSDFGKDLSIVGSKMLQLNITNTLTSLFTGKINQKLAISGHSMGGGSSFLASSNNPDLTCLFNFAAAQTSPRSSQAAKTVTVPTLILGGQSDCVVPYNTNQLVMWDSTASSKKFVVNLKNLTHCDFGNGSSFNCVFGQTSSGCSSTVSNSIALNYYMNFVNPFLDALLKSDCTAADNFMDSLNLSGRIFSKNILGSIACSNTSIKEIRNEDFILSPNPSNGNVNLIYDKKISMVEVKTTGIDGKEIEIKSFENNNGLTLDTDVLAPGIYFITIHYNGKSKTIKWVKSDF